MAVEEVRRYLLCYDITNRRRLLRVHRYLCRHAAPIQYSVFLGEFTASERDRAIAGLQEIIDERSDDVRIYSLPNRLQITWMGRSGLPEGVALVSDGQSLLGEPEPQLVID